jgi:hypothetical protein
MAQAAEVKPKNSDSPSSSPAGEAPGLYESKSHTQEDLRAIALGPQNRRIG